MVTKEQVNAYLLQGTITADELMRIVGVCKGQLDAMSSRGQTADAFRAANADADAAEVKRFG